VSAFVTLGSSAACSVIEVCDASSNEARDRISVLGCNSWLRLQGISVHLIVESEVGPSRWLG
jgi:hypothetical protein